MNKVSVFLLLLFTVLVTSCGIYNHYGFDYKQLSSVEKGMTLEEVSAALGKPAFRDFNNEGEVLTFRALGAPGYSVVKVWFKDGKVTEMKSYLEETYPEPSSRKVNSVDEQKDSSSKDSSSKVIVTSDGYTILSKWCSPFSCNLQPHLKSISYS